LKQLLLVRHAKSSWKDAARADIDRPLNGRGRRDAPRVGAYLAARGFLPDRIVSSPARRARKTAQLLAAALTGAGEQIIVLDPALYEAGAALLLERVRAFEDTWQNVMLVAHNPGLTDFANLLTAIGIDNLPTCGVIVTELAIDSWQLAEAGCGRTVCQIVPGDLPGGTVRSP
jgi:phosphohistidine phosphatase